MKVMKFSGLMATLAAAILVLNACIPPTTSKPVREAPSREARALWLHRFEYTRYTSTHDQDSIKQFIADAINNAADANFNMVLFQVRGNGDAYYTPGLEPWGELLTGQVGKDPGWDPLQFAIDKAHARGLELHAWINTFPAWRGTKLPPKTKPEAAILKHPEWLVADSAGNPMPMSNHYVSFSPGIPAVQNYIIKVATDIAQRYDVDGIHFDYIRYPEQAPELGYSHDAISVKRFHSKDGNPYQLDWADWQRAQLTHFVANMYNALKDVKPWLKMSTAVIGSYETGGWNAYNIVYQNPRRWTEIGKVDFLAPMTYFSTHTFLDRIKEWKNCYSVERYVFPGIGTFRFNGNVKGLTWKITADEIQGVRDQQLHGMVFFDASSLRDHWKDVKKNDFPHPANIPAMPWIDNVKPNAPDSLRISEKDGGVSLTWQAPQLATDGDSAWIYDIYASSKSPVDSTNGAWLQAVIPAKQHSYQFNNDVKIKTGWSFAVSALDRAHNESKLTRVVFVKTQ